MKKITYLAVACAAAFSLAAVAADDKDQKQQSQSGQSQSASGGSSSQKQAGQSSETVKQAQEKLSAEGHNVQADGIMGPKTQAAVKEYQESKGLKPSGQLDQQTMSSLGVSQGGSASSGSSSARGGTSSGSQSKDKSK